MIRGHQRQNPDWDIPLENIEINDMAKKTQTATGLLAPGTKVRVKNERHPNGDKGTIQHVDDQDLNTIYPYFVSFGSSMGWCKAKEVEEIEEPGGAANTVTALLFALILAATFLASCTGHKAHRIAPVDSDSIRLNLNVDTLHSQIPVNNG